MKIAILGFAGQGRAAYDYWNRDDNELTICDMAETIEAPDGAATKLGSDYLRDLADFDMLVRTPSLHPHDITKANPETPDILDKVTTVTDEFFKVCPTQNIIGVTGTKGKGTTSTLITRILEAAGHRVHLGGNIGTPPLDMLKADIQPDDWVVLELANFQLIDLRHSPHIAVCLMVVPEHQDWHEDMEEYIAAKQQLFINQEEDDIAIYNPDNENSVSIADASMGIQIPYMEAPGAFVATSGMITIDNTEICNVNELKLLGKHNWQNACAAVTTAWQVTQDIAAIHGVLSSFSGLEHRLELVRELDGVKYYDDSFGTTPETAIVAIEAFQEPKVVIVGGSDKGADFAALAQTISKADISKVVLIGKTGPTIREALAKVGYTNVVDGGTTMTEIVETARSHAKPGDIVLLSTGCASFGLFANYKDRGEQFKAAVSAL